ncbi:exodeoxyribonuclease III [Streptomyces tanashiensis]
MRAGAAILPWMPTVTSVNVNGLRAAAKKGFVEWLAGTSADAVCLQEVRAEEAQLPEEVRAPEGWFTVHASYPLPRAAPASPSRPRREPDAVRIGFGSAEFDTARRYVEADLPGVTVAEPLPALRRGRHRAPGREVPVHGRSPAGPRSSGPAPPPTGARSSSAATGTSPTRRPTSRTGRPTGKNAGFLPEEREWLSRVLDEGDGGYVDVVRGLHPEQEGPYSCGPTAGAPSTTTAAGASTTRSPPPASPPRRSRPTSSGPPPTTQWWSDHAPVTAVYEM